MTDYSHIVPDLMLADREPRDGALAARWEQRWLLTIDESGDVSLHCRTYYGGDATPADEYHDKVLTYPIGRAGAPMLVDVERLRADLRDDRPLASLIDEIVAGHKVEWDGSNYRGRLSEEADEAAQELFEELESGAYDSEIEVWDIEDWLGSLADPDDDTVESVMQDAADQRVYLGDREEVAAVLARMTPS